MTEVISFELICRSLIPLQLLGLDRFPFLVDQFASTPPKQGSR